MHDQPSYYELLAVERTRELQREVLQHRLAAEVACRPSMWRRSLQVLGHGLVALGTRLEGQSSVGSGQSSVGSLR